MYKCTVHWATHCTVCRPPFLPTVPVTRGKCASAWPSHHASLPHSWRRKCFHLPHCLAVWERCVSIFLTASHLKYEVCLSSLLPHSWRRKRIVKLTASQLTASQSEKEVFSLWKRLHSFINIFSFFLISASQLKKDMIRLSKLPYNWIRFFVFFQNCLES